MNFDSSFPPEGYEVRTRHAPWLLLLVVFLAAGIIFVFARPHSRVHGGVYDVPQDAVYRFEGLTGPSKETRLLHRSPTPWQRYSGGTSARLAILLTDPNSAWLGLAHGLKSLGVPFTITRDYREAVRHRAIVIYPSVSGKVLDDAALRALGVAANRGATLVSFRVTDPDFRKVFGLARAIPSRAHTTIRLDRSQPIAAEFTQPEEQTLRFADPSNAALNMGSFTYTNSNSREKPVATYEDETPAITRHALGHGTAYAFGIDVGFLLLKGYNNRQESIARGYVNGFEPTLDVLLRLLRNIYDNAEPTAVFLGSVPDNKLTSVIISHDVDSGASIGNSPAYAALEKKAGVATTYFIQTEYIRDYNDIAFFNRKGAAIVALLQRDGMEVASHSVSHSRMFAHFPMGTGRERYPSYLPFILSPDRTYNASVLGELRVSKFLLEHFTKNVPVVSFRPGDLSNPYSLPNALESAEYRYSSATTANDSLTHFPFQLNEDRAIFTESGIYEFPITLEDEAPPRMDQREPQAERLAEKIGRYGGIFAILIHPNIVSYKLDFERMFIAHFKHKAWFGTVAQFGDWWRARDAIELDIRTTRSGEVLTLRAPRRIRGLTLILPHGLRVGRTRPRGIVRMQTAGRAILHEIHGSVTLYLSATQSRRAAERPSRFSSGSSQWSRAAANTASSGDNRNSPQSRTK